MVQHLSKFIFLRFFATPDGHWFYNFLKKQDLSQNKLHKQRRPSFCFRSLDVLGSILATTNFVQLNLHSEND